MKHRLAISVALTVLAQSAFAQSSSAPIEMKNTGTPGQASAVRSMRVKATVTAVDVANRTVTLQHKGGKPETFSVGPQVTRLGDVAVGDTVVVDYKEGLMLEFQPAGTEAVEPHAVVVGDRNAKDQAPGAAAAAGVQATVTVTAIDTKTRHVVFQGPGGALYQVKAGPNVHLDKLKVGDKLLATYVQAVAINLEKAAKK
jgi:Cu/Ag efflux protein CusF